MTEFEEWIANQIKIGNLRVASHNIPTCKVVKGMLLGSWRKKYTSKTSRATRDSMEFTLTFQDYLYKAYEAGLTCPNQIGVKRDNYQLARYKDLGGYTVDNCRFITKLENQKERDEHFDVSKHIISLMEKEHPFVGKKPWNHHVKTEETLEVWEKANDCYLWWLETGFGYRKLIKTFGFKSQGASQSIINKFKEGWVPLEDTSWVEWRRHAINL